MKKMQDRAYLNASFLDHIVYCSTLTIII